MPRLRYGWMLAGLQTAVYLCGKIVSPRSCRIKISASGIRTFVDEKCYIVTKKVRRIGWFLDNVYYLCRRKMLCDNEIAYFFRVIKKLSCVFFFFLNFAIQEINNIVYLLSDGLLA